MAGSASKRPTAWNPPVHPALRLASASVPQSKLLGVGAEVDVQRIGGRTYLIRKPIGAFSVRAVVRDRVHDGAPVICCPESLYKPSLERYIPKKSILPNRINCHFVTGQANQRNDGTLPRGAPMLEVTNEFQGAPWSPLTPFERWVTEDLGLPLHSGYFAGPLSSPDLVMAPWPRKGISAAVFDLVGAESAGGMFVGELGPKASSQEVAQLFDETLYIVSGSGRTTLRPPGGPPTEFDWQKGSLFAIPLNHTYQLHNTSDKPVRFISVNTLPLMYNMLRDEDFIFNAAWASGRLHDVVAPGEGVLYRPDAQHDRTAVDLYDALLVPDVFEVPRSPFVERADFASCVYFEMANSTLSAHVLGIEGGDFFNPHRHGPAGFVFPTRGSGYSLMWPEGGEPVRFDWPTDEISLIIPPSGWWHGHFLTSQTGVHLAVKLMSRKHPVNHLYDGVHKPVSEGGTVLRYQDLDADLRESIWGQYAAECGKSGIVAREPVEQASLGGVR